jgi:hypothetical protein
MESSPPESRTMACFCMGVLGVGLWLLGDNRGFWGRTAGCVGVQSVCVLFYRYRRYAGDGLNGWLGLGLSCKG